MSVDRWRSPKISGDRRAGNGGYSKVTHTRPSHFHFRQTINAMSGTNIDKLEAYAQSLPPIQLTPTSFYFLRHGQTPGNALKVFQTYAEPLSEVGIQQALDAAEALTTAPEAVRTIVVSDAARTLQTAAPVAKKLGLKTIQTAALRERHFGDLWGTSSANIDWDCSPANGETLKEFVERTRAGILQALNGNEGPVLIVAHGGNLMVLASLLHIPLDTKMFGNALPIYFSCDGEKWSARPLLAPQDASMNMA